MSENETPQRSKPLTSREIIESLHEQAIALITRSNIARGAESIEVKQSATGTLSGQFYCSSLNTVAAEGEDVMALWSRTLDLARQVRRDLTELNASKIEEDLRATLNRSKS